ncbi:polyphosphate kinase 1 [Gloeobacter morelensis]|uniref:Polyphosphate kinase n=1 Tax=Gloeobacter morelensis MG652769 TaxID=2781736 RepID=A0ABY3PGS5_9CYAN|nr:polyphosphate kinase 1 [Gloeobacter morelensis]UFP92826.1 polyphosphate kinase 1 [Gloeobacter morelensis MG652769]
MSEASITDSVETKIGLDDPALLINRELSWLEFNTRVLDEALDERNPLLERLKFLAIFSSNLDEFFMVRVSGLKQQVELGLKNKTPDGLGPQAQLDAIVHRLRPLLETQTMALRSQILPKLAEEGIRICDYSEIKVLPRQQEQLQRYFEEQVFPVLTPLAVDPGHPFPYISNLSLSLAVLVRDPVSQKELFARVKVPQGLPRLVPLGIPNQFVALEEVIGAHLDQLFPGMEVMSWHPFRLTRNSDLEMAEEEAEDLLLTIEQSVRNRRFGEAVRLEITPQMPVHVRARLLEELELHEQDVYAIDGLLDLRCLWQLAGLERPDLKHRPFSAQVPPDFRNPQLDIFRLIRQGDRLVHHPYDSFAATVERFVSAAADDPDVLTIKQTLYRTSGDSPIVRALIRAAENGKQVAVLVELKARFDEENNINWARALERAGVHVVYGLVGLKTHAKALLVVRREKGHIRRYVHLATGNYNSKTANLYTDYGLFSCRPDLGADVTDLFNYLTGYSHQTHYRKLLVAPARMRDQFVELIDREIAARSPEAPGRIIAKMNSLVDPILIRALYRASQAGVHIDLIVRGICCLRPGYAEVSENIRVISIVGRLLEHSRVFYFGNGGNSEVYIGSADWMPRNLDRRVEVMTPVEEPRLRDELVAFLHLLLSDNRQSWELQTNGAYARRHTLPGAIEISSQQVLIDRALSR